MPLVAAKINANIPPSELAKAQALVESGQCSVEAAARRLGLVPRSLRSVAHRNSWHRPVSNWYQAALVGLRLGERGRTTKATPKNIGIVLKYLAEGYPLSTAAGMAGITPNWWEKWRGPRDGSSPGIIPGLMELEALALAHAAKTDIDIIRVNPTGRERVAQRRDPETFGTPGEGAGSQPAAAVVQINVGDLRPMPMREGAVREQLTVTVGGSNDAQTTR